MVAAQVIGNDATVAFAGTSGVFELNVMLPVIARNLLESIRLLANVTRLLADRCIYGIEADEERCRSLRRVLALDRHPAEQVHRLRRGRRQWPSRRSRRTRRSRPSSWSAGTSSRGKLTAEQLDAALDVLSMTHP